MELPVRHFILLYNQNVIDEPNKKAVICFGATEETRPDKRCTDAFHQFLVFTERLWRASTEVPQE